ncbi:hypothetical protein [Gandjariella thermophila]|uniref:DUF4878 domain-containing protein n=1 Tax=Gandjariella thermophila TaxID=1931992 RepID=A0A4D4JBH1_9PSEU|nr:hypothetical protein [Gandjariella thermophila]GDY32370.1 hypothetical protein GTS_40030 [Gandjariella thermophila]
MSDPQQSGKSAGEEGSGQDQAKPQHQGESGEGATQPAGTSAAPETEVRASHSEQPQSGTEQAQATAERPRADAEAARAGIEQTEARQAETGSTDVTGTSETQRRARWQGLLIGVGGGALVGLIVVLALGAFVWPGFLSGPGKPDGKASAATAALASKNADELEKVSCHGPDGKSTAQIPAQAMQMIQSVKPAGPTQQLLDTEAVAPVDITLSAQGQTQNVPAEVVLGVTKGQWCLKGISQRQ